MGDFWGDAGNAGCSPDAAAVRAARHRSNKDLGLRLLDCVRTGTERELEMLLGTGISPLFMDPFRGSALHQCAVMGGGQTFELLLAASRNTAPLTPSSPSMQLIMRGLPTPMHLAVWNGHNQLLGRMLSDADFRDRIDIADGRGITSLHVAAMAGNTEAVSMLVEAGATVNAQDKEGCTPLMYACSNGWLPVVDSLLSNRNNNICVLDTQRRSCLDFAATSNDDYKALGILPDPAQHYECEQWTNATREAHIAPEVDQSVLASMLLEGGVRPSWRTVWHATASANPIFLRHVLRQALNTPCVLDCPAQLFFFIYEFWTRSRHPHGSRRTAPSIGDDVVQTAALLLPYLLDSTWIQPYDCVPPGGLATDVDVDLCRRLVIEHAWARRGPALRWWASQQHAKHSA